MDAVSRWQEWCAHADSEAERSALRNMEGSEIQACFGEELAFGTGGVRGHMGPGTNRLNRCTVARLAAGYGDYLRQREPSPSVVIAFDSRLNSPEFARCAAETLAGCGVRVLLFPELVPTPVLSFAVRYLGASGGIMITASHNPAGDNGFKVYLPDGAQADPETAGEIARQIAQHGYFPPCPLPAVPVEEVPPEVTEAYLQAVGAGSVLPEGTPKSLRIVYTPLNGAGSRMVPACLSRNGYTELIPVPEQAEPDGSFPTCPEPNPENDGAWTLALRLAEQRRAELALSTDPDCDRLGAAARTAEGLVRLSGNEVALLLADYLFSVRTERHMLPEKPVLIRTLVTSPLLDRIAAAYDGETRCVLTGFKYIGQQLGLLERCGEESRFLLGAEESCGYLTGSAVRDKDGVNAAMQVCDMAAWHKAHGRTLPEALEALYARYGRIEQRLVSLPCGGELSPEAWMASLRTRPADARREDFLSPQGGLPAADLLRYSFPDGASAVLRPSGTERKLKIYLAAPGKTRGDCQARLDGLCRFLTPILEDARKNGQK